VDVISRAHTIILFWLEFSIFCAFFLSSRLIVSICGSYPIARLASLSPKQRVRTFPGIRIIPSRMSRWRLLERRIPTRARAMPSRITSVEECQQPCQSIRCSFPLAWCRPCAGCGPQPSRAPQLYSRTAHTYIVAGYGHVLCFAAISYRRRCSCLAVYATPWRESQAERDREMRQR
jgi:hypothetical protein